jgi:prolyl-tRNA editing enzyme YbaK/EbsC (Cys-tRNA(Pro) deacylase)
VTLVDLGIPGVVSALDHHDLVAPPVASALAAWLAADPDVARIGVVAIDPAIADTAAFVAHYQVPADSSINCVVVEGVRNGQSRVIAACIPADTRADVNQLIRKRLDARKCSFMKMDDAVAGSGMEYGGITPIGLPADWQVLIDARVEGLDAVIIGAGIRGAKLIVPGALLARLPGAEVVEGLGKPA